MTAAPKTPRAPSSGEAPAIKRVSAFKRMKDLVAAAKADELARDARSVLLHAAVYMDTDGWIFTSPESLAEDTGYTPKTVRTATKALREAGIVVELPPAAWKLAVQATPGANVPKGGKLPMKLLWPAASPRARLAALGALSDEPRTLTITSPPECKWIVTLDGKEHGPYQTARMEIFARTDDCAEWIVRPANGQQSAKFERWHWLGAHLPRAPHWARGE